MTTQKQAGGAVLGVILALGWLACEPPGTEPEMAPPLEAIWLDGSPLQLADLRGKTVLIDFWATWCAPCVLEIPELNALQAEHGGDDFQVLALSLDDLEREALANWVTSKDMQYPVAIASLDTAEAWRAVQFPYHVLVGPDGTILERLLPGYHDREELEALLNRHR